MATRTIQECDRCHREIKLAGPGKVVVTRGGESLDLCDSCEHKVERVLAGEELEVPP